jgi:hypothetical protein
MKLNPESLAYILNVVKTAKLVGIDNIIIEPNAVRAMDDARTVVLFQSENVPVMEFGSIGLTRIDVLMARYDIASSTQNFSVEFDTRKDNNNEYATSLILKGKGTKIEYRCADPSKINAPRQINDVIRFSVNLTNEAVPLLQKGAAAMSADIVSIISNDGVSFELVDVNNDTFKHTFADDAQLIPDQDGNVVSSTKFAHRYPVKTLLALFRSNPSGTFSIGQKGILSFPINGLTVYVLPQV